MITSLETIGFGFSAFESTQQILAADAMRIVYAVYSLSITGVAIPDTDVTAHTKSMLHLSALTFFPTIFFFATNIWPDTVLAIPGLAWSVLALYGAAAAIAFTTPLGPELHYPPEDIYDAKVIAATTNTDEANVCGVVSASTLDTLLFSYSKPFFCL